MTINWYVLKSTVVAALGGLLFGFDTAVIAGTTKALSDTYHLSPRFIGGDCCLRALGHNTRRDACRNTGRPLRTARQPQGYGCTLPDLGVGMRVCMELECGRVLSLHRRARHRWFFRARADVHSRGCASEMARAFGGILPIQRSLRDSAGLFIQLSPRAFAVWRT